jgi:hypothetical protein
MDDKYCDYHNQDWVNRFNGLRNANYITRIEGNTLYIVNQTKRKIPTYKHFFGLFYIKTEAFEEKNSPYICILPMVKIHENTLIEILEAWNINVINRK